MTSYLLLYRLSVSRPYDYLSLIIRSSLNNQLLHIFCSSFFPDILCILSTLLYSLSIHTFLHYWYQKIYITSKIPWIALKPLILELLSIQSIRKICQYARTSIRLPGEPVVSYKIIRTNMAIVDSYKMIRTNIDHYLLDQKNSHFLLSKR